MLIKQTKTLKKFECFFMKKIMKRVLPLALSLLTIGSATACNKNRGTEEQIDADKTQLYVYCYGGGVGSQWVRKVKTRFESDFADYEFEPGSGKKGVQVLIETIWVDERLTTVSAERALLEADVSRAKRKKVIDKMAAVIILQSYLDRL